MIARCTPGPALFTVIATLALLATGCPSEKRHGSGCKRDTDCKGDRVCVAGACQESGGGAAQPQPQQPQAKPGPQQPPPPPAPAAPNPNAMAADGLPVVIPAPGSPPPTMAEWDAVPTEVRVAGSSSLGCETKMLREWLRASCRRKGVDVPIDVRNEHTQGQQAYTFKTAGSVTSTVVQVVRGKDYRAAFTWDSRGRHWEATLYVSWPVQAARPTMSFRQ